MASPLAACLPPSGRPAMHILVTASLILIALALAAYVVIDGINNGDWK